jgi:hemolysin III
MEETSLGGSTPMRAMLREPVNSLTHLIAAGAAAIGVALLIYLAQDDMRRVVSLTVYGMTLILMFTASGVYHTLRLGPRGMLFLRKLDHSAIYLLIAGTYTPICLHYFTGFWQWGMVAIVWALALIGITVKLFVIDAPRWISTGAYLLMGWLSLIGVKEIVTRLPAAALIWLALGGLFFSVGAIIYALKKPNPWPHVFGFHEIWHIFVILGAASHYIVMAGFVAPGSLS